MSFQSGTTSNNGGGSVPKSFASLVNTGTKQIVNQALQEANTQRQEIIQVNRMLTVDPRMLDASLARNATSVKTPQQRANEKSGKDDRLAPQNGKEGVKDGGILGLEIDEQDVQFFETKHTERSKLSIPTLKKQLSNPTEEEEAEALEKKAIQTLKDYILMPDFMSGEEITFQPPQLSEPQKPRRRGRNILRFA